MLLAVLRDAKDLNAPKCNRCTGVFDALRLGATPSGATSIDGMTSA